MSFGFDDGRGVVLLFIGGLVIVSTPGVIVGSIAGWYFDSLWVGGIAISGITVLWIMILWSFLTGASLLDAMIEMFADLTSEFWFRFSLSRHGSFVAALILLCISAYATTQREQSLALMLGCVAVALIVFQTIMNFRLRKISDAGFTTSVGQPSPEDRSSTKVIVKTGATAIVGATMTTNETHTIIKNSQVHGVAIAQSTVNQSNSSQRIHASTPEHVSRDQFEREVAEILSSLIDAKESLEADYEAVRIALRKLATIEIEQNELIAEAQRKLEAVLTAEDKGALKKLSEANRAVATNIVSSWVWTYLIQPIITAL